MAVFTDTVSFPGEKENSSGKDSHEKTRNRNDKIKNLCYQGSQTFSFSSFAGTASFARGTFAGEIKNYSSDFTI